MTHIPDLSVDIRREANQRLDRIEGEHGVRILLAVESGSRAWGFPSPDSDLDVRFLYVRPTEDYLRLAPIRDVIEAPIEGDWDVNGWDLKKALKLFAKGNAVVVEWLRSPLVYREVGPIAGELRWIADRHASPELAVRHYHGLLHGVLNRDFAGRERVKLKKSYYAARAAAAIAWTRRRGEVPPMDLPSLLREASTPAPVREVLAELLEQKSRRSEIGDGPRIESLDGYIRDQLAWAAERLTPAPGSVEALQSELEQVFLRALDR
jgi:predicted nucleotidyltransferase